MKQKENEDRADYLIRVVHAFMNETYAGSEHIEYDESDCDGLCLADDIDSEITFLKNQRDELLAALKKVQEDINWMCNSEKLLNRFVFNYVDDAIDKADLTQ